MATASTRELKQNPSAVIRRVLHTRQGLEITAHGHDTGVKLVPSSPSPARWVSGSELNQSRPDAWTSEQRERLHADLAGIDDEGPVDPYARGGRQ